MPSSSHSDEPTSWPCALANGNIIAPPIRIVSATSRKASRTPILSVTLAPPTMATSGRSGSARMPVSVSTSRWSRRPAALGSSLATPWVEAWARWAAPNASFTNTSPSAAYRLASSGSSSVSPSKKRTFSTITTSPAGRASASGSSASATSTSSSSPRRSATGFSDSSGSRPFGRPRWASSTSRSAPFSRSSRRVGSAAWMRASSVMAPSCSGTLKSTRTTTALPADVEVVERAHPSTGACPRGPRRGWSSPTRCRTRTRS